MRIGTVEGDGPASFGGGQLSVALHPGGDVLVLDHQAREIRRFAADGGFVGKIGGPGQGPGEFDAPTGILIDHQARIWVPEAFAGRYSIFDPDGRLIRTLPRKLRGYNRLRALHFEGPGAFIDHAAVGGAGFFRVDTTGAVLDTFPPIAYVPLPPRLGGPLRGPPDAPLRVAVRHFLPRTIWALAPDGTLWTGRTDALRLVQRTLEGDTLRIVESRHREGRFTREEAGIVDRATRELGGPSPFRPQVMSAIHVLDDGHLLVQIAGEMGGAGGVFDVFDPEGRFLGSMPTPFAMPSIHVPALVGDTIIAVDTDAWDVRYVVSAVIRRVR